MTQPRRGEVRARNKRYARTSPPPPLTHRPFLELLTAEDPIMGKKPLEHHIHEIETRQGELTDDLIGRLRNVLPKKRRVRRPSPTGHEAMRFMARHKGIYMPAAVWARNAEEGRIRADERERLEKVLNEAWGAAKASWRASGDSYWEGRMDALDYAIRIVEGGQP